MTALIATEPSEVTNPINYQETEMDRRSLLKSAAALSATAAVAPVATIADAAPAAEVITPANLTPYANYVWEWFVSHDGETYYEGFPTKEEALAYAKQEEYALVAECKQQDFCLELQGWRILEQLNDDNMEMMGEGEGIEATPAQERDLEDMVRRAIEAWVVKHGIRITAWSFADTQNETKVEAPAHSL